MLKTAYVIFEDPKNNYHTSVNSALSDEEIKNYFIGAKINVGSYPQEIFKKVIDCKVIKE